MLHLVRLQPCNCRLLQLQQNTVLESEYLHLSLVGRSGIDRIVHRCESASELAKQITLTTGIGMPAAHRGQKLSRILLQQMTQVLIKRLQVLEIYPQPGAIFIQCIPVSAVSTLRAKHQSCVALHHAYAEMLRMPLDSTYSRVTDEVALAALGPEVQ